MKQIEVVKPFRHCVQGAIYPQEFVVTGQPIDVDDETAQIALDNGWAKETSEKEHEKKDDGPQSQDSGKERPSVSSEPAPVSQESKSKLLRGRGKKR